MREPRQQQCLETVSLCCSRRISEKCVKPLLITLPSAYHSPITVKRNAIVLTMGTVKLSSVRVAKIVSHIKSHGVFLPIKAGGLPPATAVKHTALPEGEEQGLTGLSNEKKEPNTPRQVQQQRNGISGVPQQIDNGEEG